MSIESTEEKLNSFIRQYEIDRLQDERKANRDKYQLYMYVAWGFTLTMAALAASGGVSSSVQWISLAGAAFFFIIGWVSFIWFRKWR